MKIVPAAFLVLLCSFSASASVVEQIAAIVNSDPILLSEIQEQIPASQRNDNAALWNVLNLMIDQRLQLQEAKKKGVSATEDEIKAFIADIRMKNGLNTEEAFKKSLEKENMSLEKFQSEVRNQVIVRKLIQREILPDILLKEEDLKKYYLDHSSLFGIPEKRVIRQILFPAAGPSSEEEKNLAARLYTFLQEGKSPEEAVSADIDLRGAFRESSLGAFKKGELLPEIDRVIFSTEPGKWSSPVATSQGIHIFKTDVTGGALRPFEEVREEIKERIFQEQTETAIGNWMANLRKSATIELVIYTNNTENAPRARHEK